MNAASRDAGDLDTVLTTQYANRNGGPSGKAASSGLNARDKCSISTAGLNQMNQVTSQLQGLQ